MVNNMSIDSSACNCIGPQNGEPLCPCAMRAQGIFERDGKWIKPAATEKILGEVMPTLDDLLKGIKKGGFEPIEEKQKTCMDPEHEPPWLLHIPYGQQYRHICPTCGQEKIIKSSAVTF